MRSLLPAVLAVLVALSGASSAYARDGASVDEMVAKGRKMVEEMRQMQDKAEGQLRSARRANNTVLLDCVNEGLLALKGVLRLAEDYVYDMEAEGRQSNAKGVGELLGKVKIAREKSEQLEARILSCGGPAVDGVVEGKPVVEKITDVDLPGDSSVESLDSEAIFVDRPSVVSPYN